MRPPMSGQGIRDGDGGLILVAREHRLPAQGEGQPWSGQHHSPKNVQWSGPGREAGRGREPWTTGPPGLLVKVPDCGSHGPSFTTA